MEKANKIKVLISMIGLDDHSVGGEVVSSILRNAGMEVVYEGIRLTPEQIAESALQEGVHAVGLSILSGSHLRLVPEVVSGLDARGLGRVPVVLGGIIPEADAAHLPAHAVRRVFTPRDYHLGKVVGEVLDVIAQANGVDL